VDELVSPFIRINIAAARKTMLAFTQCSLPAGLLALMNLWLVLRPGFADDRAHPGRPR
jgi:hypothetical protein